MINAITLEQKFSTSTISENKFIYAARKNKSQLSQIIQSAFHTAQQAIDDIKPVFLAVAGGVKARVDKLAKMGKAGQALWDKPGMHYGGNNLVVGMQRKMRRLWRAAELKSMGFVRS